MLCLGLSHAVASCCFLCHRCSQGDSPSACAVPPPHIHRPWHLGPESSNGDNGDDPYHHSYQEDVSAGSPREACVQDAFNTHLPHLILFSP